MKLIKVENTGLIMSPIYGYSSMRVCLCSVPRKKFVKLLFTPQNCREEFTRIIRETLFPGKNTIKEQRLANMDTRRTRLFCQACVSLPQNVAEKYLQQESAFRRKIGEFIGAEKSKLYEMCTKARQSARGKLIIGQKLVNHYEKKHGWPLTRFYKVDLDKNPQVVAYVAVGSGKWQKTPHYLSMYILMLRIGTRNFKIKDWNQKTINNALSNFRGEDSGFIKNTFKKWDILLANYDKLVGKNTMKDMFSTERLAHGSNGYSEGIYQLCCGDSYDLSLSYKLQDICRKLGIHQRVNIKP